MKVMKNKKISVNKISAGLMIGVILAMVIRIVYVNITYPSTDMKIIKDSDTLYKKDYSIAIKLLRFARYFGIAFQIKDDLNNLVGENKEKPELNDIKSGIYNSNVIFANYDYPDLINKTENEYINIIKNEKYTKKSVELIQKYIKKAKKELEILENKSYKEDLFTIIDMFML